MSCELKVAVSTPGPSWDSITSNTQCNPGAYNPITEFSGVITDDGAFKQRFMSFNLVVLSLFGYFLFGGSVITYFLSSSDTKDFGIILDFSFRDVHRLLHLRVGTLLNPRGGEGLTPLAPRCANIRSPVLPQSNLSAESPRMRDRGVSKLTVS
ncbi:MAG: hypothetical protein F6J90_42100 [Moorea sp. SIOASIH]|uniref:hypothetical protein n=1 Tax=Moorena sp. SIOASIH TaxID=2607817 RepID=UPI0013B87BE1|nr:hypothetical protein [Moorena sp. SIOASIH]NEO42563.1 hypothetical protein [Moorena sp. SIOASIH]